MSERSDTDLLNLLPGAEKPIEYRVAALELKMALMARMIQALLDHGIGGARTSAEAQQFKQEMEK